MHVLLGRGMHKTCSFSLFSYPIPSSVVNHLGLYTNGTNTL